MKKKTILFLLLVVCLVLISPCALAQEKITITTYYPAPYGVYNQILTRTLGVGDNDGDGVLDSGDVPDPSLQPGDVWIRGNVGIGTDTPQAKLHIIEPKVQGQATLIVNGDHIRLVDTSPEIFFQDSNHDDWRVLVDEDAIMFIGGAAGDEEMRIAGNGNVGIGTDNPQARLHVVDTPKVQGQATLIVNGDHIRLVDTSPEIQFSDSDDDDWRIVVNKKAIMFIGGIADSEEMRIAGNGNVGIGTDNPAYNLEVIGTIRSSGKGTFSGGIDPPYVSYTSESHESIRQQARDVEEHEKVMVFWNGEAHRLEVYVIEEDRFYMITGELIEG
jgi:hypothetical protein